MASAWRVVRTSVARMGTTGRRMVSSGSWHTSGAAGTWQARSGKAFLVSGLAVVGSGALLASRSPARAESSDMAEEPGFAERAVSMIGLGSWFKWVREPAERAGCPPGKLLPDPMDLPPGVIQRTLVLSLEDTLIHTEWDRKFGHRTRKRPGLDAFLAHASQYYEIVIFTSALSSYGQPITQQMQDAGGGYFQHSLFNEHTKGGYKDLSYLNRDLRHVIIVDTNPESYGLQKYNGVAIKPWDGDLHDTELLNLVPFLEAVFKEDIQDVREVIKGMEGYNIPQRLRELKQQQMSKRPAARQRGGAGAGVLASIAVKAPVTNYPARAPAARAPAAPAPAPAPATLASDPAGAAAETTQTKEAKEEQAKKKLFQHRL